MSITVETRRKSNSAHLMFAKKDETFDNLGISKHEFLPSDDEDVDFFAPAQSSNPLKGFKSSAKKESSGLTFAQKLAMTKKTFEAEPEQDDDEEEDNEEVEVTLKGRFIKKSESNSSDDEDEDDSSDEETEDEEEETATVQVSESPVMTTEQVSSMKDKLQIKRNKAQIFQTHPRVMQNLMKLYNVQPPAAPIDSDF